MSGDWPGDVPLTEGAVLQAKCPSGQGSCRRYCSAARSHPNLRTAHVCRREGITDGERIDETEELGSCCG